MEIKKNGQFFKTLVFDREVEGNKEKVAYFTDKFGKNSKVVTTWGGLIPKLKYSCQLEVTDEKDDSTGTIIYKLLKYRVWMDKLEIIRNYNDPCVKIVLSGKEVENLTYDGNSSNYEEKVSELKTYFREKSFQLKDKESIAKFIRDYRKACEGILQN